MELKITFVDGNIIIESTTSLDQRKNLAINRRRIFYFISPIIHVAIKTTSSVDHHLFLSSSSITDAHLCTDNILEMLLLTK